MTTNLLDRLQNAIADRYVIQREVGRGGMANVYLAHDVRHDRAVAVKVLRPELGVLLGAERFLREIRVVARLQHPHILPVHDSGEVEGALYYVMPFVEGASLRDRLRQEHRLPINEAARIACEIARALDLAHRRGVIHRDIKPGNILFVDGHAVVADFGIARAVHAAGGEMWETITDSGVALGTPAYMSPEQAVGSAKLDARADIYSLGCVLHEMLIGEPPFIGPGGEVLIAKRFAEDPPRVSAFRPDIPPELDEVVAKALARTPEDRWPSARDLIDALSPVATTGQSPAHRPPQRVTVSRPVALVVASVMVAAASMFVWLAQRPGSPRAPVADTSAQITVHPPSATELPAVPPASPSGSAQPGRDSVLTPPAAPTPPPRSANPPERSPDVTRPSAPSQPRQPATTPAADRAAAVARARLDSIFQSVAASAQDARRRAVAAGALPADLARGDSIFADARSLADRGRWSEAMQRITTLNAVWMDAQRVATARRATDSQVARVPSPPPATPRITAPRDTPAAPTTPPTDPRADIGDALSRYARALESRDLAELQRAYPGLTPAQRQSWERFFRDVQDMRASLTIAGLDVKGDVAEARVTGQYQYNAAGARRQETQRVAFRATFRRDGGTWRLAAVTQ
ncbi:MAG: protein kinase [Geminicoccaceae bacterium]|nr:protein kinase [Geminicoccaceae bacterium]